MTRAPDARPEPAVGRDDAVRRLRALLGANRYMTLATVDADGHPWASTVWYAARVDTDRAAGTRVVLLWLSRPEAQHSRNLLDRPELAVTVFDSTQPPDTGEGLQLSAHGGLGRSEDLDADIETFSAASVAAGGRVWGRASVEPPAALRLYSARVDVAHVLRDGEREDVPLR